MGKNPLLRQAAIRRIATRYGSTELPWLQDFAYSAKHWASQREAMDQVVRLDPPDLVEWLTDMAETHPVDKNRRHAMDYVAARQGTKCFTWLLYRMQEDSSPSIQYRATEFLRNFSRLMALEDQPVQRQDIEMLKRAASAESHPDLRARLVGTLLNLAAREPWARSWFDSLLRLERGDYYRAELLGAALRVWTDSELLAQLERIATAEPDKKDGYATSRDHARRLLQKLTPSP
jgi:hypothetical protein